MEKSHQKIIRITTVPVSLLILLKGQLKFMNNYYEVIGVSSHGNELAEVEKNEGIVTYAIDMTRTITPFKDLKALYQLYKFLKKEHPFIVHTHTPKAGTLGMLAAKLAGVKHRLHTVAGLPLLETKGLKRFILNIVEKLTYQNATKVFPNALGLNNIILEQKFADSSKLKIIGNGSSNGIDTYYFNPNSISNKSKEALKETLGITKDSFVFIFVGRIVKDKGINELIGAFKELIKVHPNCKLLLLGFFEEALNPLYPNTLSEIETNDHISLIGWQDDVRPYYAIANTLVFPTYREGFPNVVLQAGAMGLPSIVTDINGCNEIIKDGFNGIIIPPKNEKELLNAMMHMIENPNVVEKLSESARDNVINKYQQEFVWKAILKEYQELENV